MLKSLALLSLLATLPLANAQNPDPAPQAGSDPSQSPAPIIRSYQQNGAPAPRYRRQPAPTVESQPIAGVWLRSEANGSLTTISATAQRTEIRLDHGRLNVSVHQPAQHAEILIDLPGGQTSLLKDGLYTFNADTNTVRVLRGEAAYIGPIAASENTKPIKIKEDHQLSLVAAPGLKTPASKQSDIKSVESYPYELTADLLPPDNHGEPNYPRYAGDYPAYGPYPYYAGFYGYPGYYGYGYPFAYGVGFGYYGGFGGGYRGGFRR